MHHLFKLKIQMVSIDTMEIKPPPKTLSSSFIKKLKQLMASSDALSLRPPIYKGFYYIHVLCVLQNSALRKSNVKVLGFLKFFLKYMYVCTLIGQKLIPKGMN